MTTTDAAPRLPQLLDINDLMALLRLGRTTTYARTRESDFPDAVILSEGCYRWWGHEVEAWLESRRMHAHRKATRAARAATTAPTTVDVTVPAPTPVAKRKKVAA